MVECCSGQGAKGGQHGSTPLGVDRMCEREGLGKAAGRDKHQSTAAVAAAAAVTAVTAVTRSDSTLQVTKRGRGGNSSQPAILQESRSKRLTHTHYTRQTLNLLRHRTPEVDAAGNRKEGVGRANTGRRYIYGSGYGTSLDRGRYLGITYYR